MTVFRRVAVQMVTDVTGQFGDARHASSYRPIASYHSVTSLQARASL